MKISFRFPRSVSSDATRRYRRRVLMLACVLILVLPLAWRGASCGHDFNFHLESWLAVVRQWREGVFYPHWAAAANFGAGEPRFIFYPPASWMLGALLGVVLPWTWVPLLFMLLSFLGCAAAFFKMAREWMPDDAAALAACIYVVNPYLLFTAYERTAYGELLAGALLPLAVLYGLRRTPSLLPLAITVAAVWLTDTPAAVMCCYVLAVIVIVAAIAERCWRLVLRALGAVALGLALAAFYVVPAWYEQRWVELARAIAPGMRIEDSFLFGRTGDAFHDQVLHTASWIAVALLAVTVLAAASFFRRTRALAQGLERTSSMSKTCHPDPERSEGKGPAFLARPLIFLSAAIACLLLPFSLPAWLHLPELKFLQFPWRWLLVLGLCAAALAGLALRGGFREAKTRRDIRSRAIWALLLAFGIAGISSSLFWQPCDDQDNIPAQISAFHNGGFEGTDEYTPTPADNGDIQTGLPRVRVVADPDAEENDSSVAENPAWKPAAQLPAKVQILQWNADRKRVEITTRGAGYAVLRLLDYPAWQVRVNGVLSSGREQRDDGLMVIPVAAGTSQIAISYRTTEDLRTGRAISLGALMLLAILYLAQRRGHLKRQV